MAKRKEGKVSVNLDFESANLTGYSPGNTVPATKRISWVGGFCTIYSGTNDFSLSGESISIIDTNSANFTTSIQGRYYAPLFVAGNSPGSTQTISLGQTGTIPSGTESITFWGNIGGLQISFAGQSLAFSEIGSTANYNIYGANISQFDGDTRQLLFTMSAFVNTATLDNIQLSSTMLPESKTVGLLCVGGLLFGLHRRKSK